MANLTQTKSGYTQFNEYINYATAPLIENINILLRGHRLKGADGELAPLQPNNVLLGAAPNMFQEYRLPNFANGDSFVTWASQMGFSVKKGITKTLVIPAPATVTANPDTSVTLTWTAQFTGYTNLVTGASLLQATSNATGIISSISNETASITIIGVTGTFNTTNKITVTYIQQNTGNVLDPSGTDEIVLGGYRLFEAINTKLLTQSLNTITPNVYMAWQPPVMTTDSGYYPETTPIVLGEADSFATLPNGHTAIYFNTVPDNFGFVPSWEMGNTTITDETNTGTVLGYLPGAVSGGIGIEVKNWLPTEDFLNTESDDDILTEDGDEIVVDLGEDITVVLDGTYNMYDNLLIHVNYTNSMYEMVTAGDVSASISQPFFSFIANNNAGYVGADTQVWIFGVVANITTLPTYNACATLPLFQGTQSAPAQYILPTYNYYDQMINDLPYTAYQEACDWMGMAAIQASPYYTLNGEFRTATLPTSSNAKSYIPCGPGKLSDVILNRGWTVTQTNGSGIKTIYNAVTSLVYQQGTSTIDYEFYPLTIWQRENYFKYQINALVARLKAIYKRATKTAMSELVIGAKQIATTMASDDPINGNMLTVTADMLSRFKAVVGAGTDTQTVTLYTEVSFTPDWNSTVINVTMDSYLNVVEITNG